jgi:hypothetical protein
VPLPKQSKMNRKVMPMSWEDASFSSIPFSPPADDFFLSLSMDKEGEEQARDGIAMFDPHKGK